MPAERTKCSKRRDVEGNQLTCAPIEQQFAFAPNVTPVTFNDPPALVDPLDATLFPPADFTSPRRPGHTKKKPENHIPRPPNAFILFRSSFIKSQHVSTEVETNHSTLSKIIGLTWQNLPHDERQVWHAKAKAALDEHKRKFPKYAFRPLHQKGKGPEKRKVREVGPKDLKRCAKIAELLVEGKKGHELDEAIQEFDRHHVPEVVTRFEEPITARTYRRSSSAPVPDTDHSRDTFLPSTDSSRNKRVRASSSRPTRHSSPCPPLQLPPSPSYGSTVDSVYDTAFSPSPTPSSEYSFPPTPSPSFDFSSFSFSFDNGIAAQMLPHDPCDPCDPCTSPADAPAMYGRGDLQPRLSIVTSFLNDLKRCSSPTSTSPETPQTYYPATPSPCDAGVSQESHNAFANFANLDQFDIAPQPYIPDLQIYSKDTPVYCAPSPSLEPQYDFSRLPKDHFCSSSKPHLANLDLEFGAFMASLPPSYAM